jgi:hypothetical protein
MPRNADEVLSEEEAARRRDEVIREWRIPTTTARKSSESSIRNEKANCRASSTSEAGRAGKAP